ncbi:hypothetical protein ACLI4Z_06790 [Natrialbaceae archaeon A-arb3/5]
MPDSTRRSFLHGAAATAMVPASFANVLSEESQEMYRELMVEDKLIIPQYDDLGNAPEESGSLISVTGAGDGASGIYVWNDLEEEYVIVGSDSHDHEVYAEPGAVQETIDAVSENETGGSVKLIPNREYDFTELHVYGNVTFDYNGAWNEFTEDGNVIYPYDGAVIHDPVNIADVDDGFTKSVFALHTHITDNFGGSSGTLKIHGGWSQGDHFDPSGTAFHFYSDHEKWDDSYDGSSPRIEFVDVRNHNFARFETGVLMEIDGLWGRDEHAGYINGNKIHGTCRRCETFVKQIGNGDNDGNEFRLNVQPSTPSHDFPGTDVIWDLQNGRWNTFQGTMWDVSGATHDGAWRIDEYSADSNVYDNTLLSFTPGPNRDENIDDKLGVDSNKAIYLNKIDELGNDSGDNGGDSGTTFIGYEMAYDSNEISFTVPYLPNTGSLVLEVNWYRDRSPEGTNNPLHLKFDTVSSGSYTYIMQDPLLEGEKKAGDDHFTLIEPGTGDEESCFGQWTISREGWSSGGELAIFGDGSNSGGELSGSFLRRGTTSSSVIADDLQLTIESEKKGDDGDALICASLFLDEDRSEM